MHEVLARVNDEINRKVSFVGVGIKISVVDEVVIHVGKKVRIEVYLRIFPTYGHRNTSDSCVTRD